MRADLPTGTVTFLFTDVEGSTRLLQQLGPAKYAAALAEHRRALRDALARFGGVEVDAHGEEFFAAFSTAEGALAAAREVTEAFAASAIRVRVGIHTGEPLLTDEGYVGVDVHRAARIAGAGHGGQVLVSESTVAFVEEGLRPLGEHRLRDLLEPIRLFQLGEGTFPPLAALAATNLPVQPTPFLGRERELAEVLALLGDPSVRLLTLTGTGGTGKTRLALQAAAEVAGEYADGVFWVPLQSVRDAEHVWPFVAQVVGANDDLAVRLRSRRALVLLDNFEQVIDAARHVADLVTRHSFLKVVVTSREPLHLAAEHEYAVPPLSEREAVALFAERARSVRPGFTEDEAVREVCRRLDCLPLALELAAARVKALSTDDLLRRLERRLPLLTGGPRDAPERQRTLRAAITWSYELLTPDEQRVFAALALFVGGCTLEAAEAVCQTDLDTIAALVDKSLLRREGERYSLLETIGEYAHERLEEGGGVEELRRRHAEYYLGLARSVEDLVRSPEAAALLDRLERDHDNLRAALAWLSGEPDRALRLAVWGLAGRLHSFGDAALDRRDPAEAARLYRQSLEVGRRFGDDLQTTYCLAGLAAVSASQGRRELAAYLWGFVQAFEDAAGMPLNPTERSRYERELDQALLSAPGFARGKSASLDEAVEHALSVD
jgi:predicted ATPase/class 3 adenylate cyclase